MESCILCFSCLITFYLLKPPPELCNEIINLVIHKPILIKSIMHIYNNYFILV